MSVSTVSLVKVVYSVHEHTPGFMPDSAAFVTSDPEAAFRTFLDQLDDLRSSQPECECESDMTDMCDGCLEDAHIAAYISECRVSGDVRAFLRQWAIARNGTLFAYVTDPTISSHRRVALEYSI